MTVPAQGLRSRSKDVLAAIWSSVRDERAALGRPPRVVVVTTAVGLLGTAAVTAAVLLRLTTAWDAETLRWFTGLDRPGLTHVVVRAVVTLGAFWLVGLVIGVLALVLSWRRRRPAVAVVCGAALVAMDVFIALIKVITGRTAPHTGVDQILVGGSSYPSGHTAHATVGLTLLAVLLARPVGDGRSAVLPSRRRWAAVTFGSVVVGLTTVILGYHWFTEVIAGWFMAVTVLAPAVWVLTAVPPAQEGTAPALGQVGAGRSAD